MRIKDIIETTRVFLRDRKVAYSLTFRSPAGQLVLRDLNKFCRGTESEWADDARHHARLAGRREVILRIAQHMNLSTDQLFALYNGSPIPTAQEARETDDE